ncbi:MAG: hypothetical protein K2X32_08700 [Phycisphaerales bacterium]|nr:hypothetical protein [Phycisphaerales bacterium]
MHGLAINVSPNLTHFDLIVPCGLADRRVTSLAALLGDRAPSINDTKALVIEGFSAMIEGVPPLRGGPGQTASRADE